MPITVHTAAEVRTALVAFCKKHTIQAKAAKALGVTASQLSLALSSKSDIVTAKIVQKLGYRAVTAYVPRTKKAKTGFDPRTVAKKPRKINRDAGTGKLVTKTFAEENPSTTVQETVEDRDAATVVQFGR